MSLPARQQRVLHDIEELLQAGEPRLAGMYAIFARLNADEPMTAESLGRGRLAWRGTAVCAAVLVPVMFGMIALGVLLGGSARGATTCGATHSAARGAPWASQGSCPARPATRARASMKAGASTQANNGQPVPVSAIAGGQAHGSAVTGSAGAACVTRMRDARPAIPPSPAARSPAPALGPGTC
jgi:hypothetical protein